MTHFGHTGTDQPGLYFVGQHLLNAFWSTKVHGVGCDAALIAGIAKERAAAAALASRVA